MEISTLMFRCHGSSSTNNDAKNEPFLAGDAVYDLRIVSVVDPSMLGVEAHPNWPLALKICEQKCRLTVRFMNEDTE